MLALFLMSTFAAKSYSPEEVAQLRAQAGLYNKSTYSEQKKAKKARRRLQKLKIAKYQAKKAEMRARLADQLTETAKQLGQLEHQSVNEAVTAVDIEQKVEVKVEQGIPPVAAEAQAEAEVIEQKTEEKIAEGLPPVEAKAEAQAEVAAVVEATVPVDAPVYGPELPPEGLTSSDVAAAEQMMEIPAAPETIVSEPVMDVPPSTTAEVPMEILANEGRGTIIDESIAAEGQTA